MTNSSNLTVAINGWFYHQINTGSGQYLHYLVSALGKIAPDLQLMLIVPKVHGSYEKTEIPNQPHVKIISTKDYPIFNSPTGLKAQLYKVWFEQVVFPSMANKIGADVAHVPYFGSAMFPKITTVATIHDVIPIVLPEYRGGVMGRLYTKLVSVAAKRANLILADSESSRQDILHHLHIMSNKVRTVYLAAAPHYGSPKKTDIQSYLKRKYNLPQNYVLYIGGYDVRKNVSVLLRAWAKVITTNTDFTGFQNLTGLRLVLAGKIPTQDTPFFPNPLKTANQFGIADSIVTPGWIDESDKHLMYQAAQLFVYQSRYEGFGLPVLEAMSCGTPVITSNVSSIPELVNSAGVLIAPDDVDGLSQAIIKLLTDHEFYKSMVEQGYKQASTFTWEKTAMQTWQAYIDIGI